MSMNAAALQDKLGAVVADVSKGDKAKARKAAEDFEAVFLAQMLNTMSEGIKTDSMFGGGQQEQMFRGMLYDKYAESIAKRGGIGVADQVYKEILKLQEVQAEAAKEDQALHLDLSPLRQAAKAEPAAAAVKAVAPTSSGDE